MIRILGIIVGAFLAASALVLFLGIPEFHRRDAGDASQARMVAAIENAQNRWEERAQPEPAEPVLTQAPPDAALPPLADSTPTVQQDISLDQALAPARTEWHAIWTPFRTEIAARGFVSRLESVTGLDYRVQKLGKGAWQVAFAYVDETDLDAGLEQIAAATGLDLTADRR